MIKAENMIPKVYMQSWDMRTMCRIFDAEFVVLRYYTQHILDCYSPEHCPEDLLQELATHIGFEYQPRKSVMYNRIVLKNFIRNLIRYRGSITGIRNAAAIDIRYRETYPDKRFDIDTGEWVDENPEIAGTQIPMSYHEALPIEKAWVDVDHQHSIIYLFLIASEYFKTSETSDDAFKSRMRKLLDLAHLQEYVRPVGMYLLPMIAEKADAETDITVRAVRIPRSENQSNNGVSGTPNASTEMQYDRIHFAHIENDNQAIEPWANTLYHSQLAGALNKSYFTAPVYYIQGKFLYYNHDELVDVYSRYAAAGTAAKIGDSLYNPNLPKPPRGYNYGPDRADEPASLQSQALWEPATDPLAYDDHGVFDGIDRIQEVGITLTSDIPISENDYPAYLSGKQLDASNPESETPATNKNLMVNLFNADTENSDVQTIEDIAIQGKPRLNPDDICYDPKSNQDVSGDDIYYNFRDADSDEQIP